MRRSRPVGVAPLVRVGADVSTADDEPLASLPRDHPAWQRDLLAVSARTRAVLATLRIPVVAVVTFWQHALRSVIVGGGTLEIDPAGSYRLRR